MKALLGSAVALALCVSSSASAAPTTTRYRVSGDTAYVGATSYADCEQSSFEITASDSVSRGQDGESTRGALITYTRFDLCNQIYTSGSAEIPLSQDITLTAATIEFAVDVHSVGYEITEWGDWIAVDLGVATLSGSASLVGTGTLEKGSQVITSSVGTSRTVSRYSGSHRTADVTLTVASDGVPLTFDFTTGTLGNYKNSSFEITHQ